VYTSFFRSFNAPTLIFLPFGSNLCINAQLTVNLAADTRPTFV
jgi:hypothetical protein